MSNLAPLNIRSKGLAMAERVPPLLWVRVFEAAARHGNFVIAAAELSVSPAAVSRTVKELEEFMGVALFMRHARGVELLDIGRNYARAVGPAIRQIAAASAQINSKSRQISLQVSAMPAFAQRWLVPQLGEFNEQHPEVTVIVSAESAVLDLSNSSFDVALRYDSNHLAGLERIELFGEQLFPVVSPKLALSARLNAPEDLFSLTVLHDTYWESDWRVWLAALNMEPPKRWRGHHFTLYTMAVDAAVAGQGVLMGHAALIKKELESGELVAPFGQSVTSPKRYYAIAHPEKSSVPAVRVFMNWLGGLREAGCGQ